jgi:hypothetical protein
MSEYLGNTIVEHDTHHSALCALAQQLCASWPLEWRHHGIGVLQAYIPYEYVPAALRIRAGVALSEHRLHIWSRSLVKPGIDIAGDIHDHRFDMVSHVLHGKIYNEEVQFIEREEGHFGAPEYAMVDVVNARKAGADTNFDAPTVSRPGRFVVNHVISSGIVAGKRYRFPKRHFHRTPVKQFTITWVEKYNTDESSPARIAHPIDIPLVHAFGHEPDQEQVKRLVALAHEVLT